VGRLTASRTSAVSTFASSSSVDPASSTALHSVRVHGEDKHQQIGIEIDREASFEEVPF
jgi:hypothetical protein